jgi:hypothetical protein
MYRGLALSTPLCLISLLGCGEDQVVCAPLPPWAVAVEVRDSVTGALLVSGATERYFSLGC